MRWVLPFLFVTIGFGLGLIGVDFRSAEALTEPVAQELDQGRALLHRDSVRSVERSFAHFEKAITLNENCAEAWADWAEAELAWAELSAIAILEKDQTPGADPPVLPLGIQHRVSSAFDKAARALELEPDNLSANFVLADYYRLMGAREPMLFFVGRMRDRLPRSAEVAYVLGADAATHSETLDQAVEQLETALRLAPKRNRVRLKLAMVHRARGEIALAQQQTRQILVEVPDHEGAQIIQASLGPLEAIPETQEISDANLSYDELLNRASQARNRGRPSVALGYLNKALEQRPNDTRGWIGAGWCKLDLNRPAEAVADFHRVLKHRYRSPRAHLGLGEAYRMLGQGKAAIKHYRRYLEMMPNGSEADLARRMMEAIRG